VQKSRESVRKEETAGCRTTSSWVSHISVDCGVALTTIKVYDELVKQVDDVVFFVFVCCVDGVENRLAEMLGNVVVELIEHITKSVHSCAICGAMRERCVRDV